MDVWGTNILADVEDVLNEFKRQTGADLFSVIKSTPTDVMTQCPFHKGGHENKPSFGISKVKKVRGKRVIEAGTAHCFTCGYTEDLANFLSDLMNKKDGGKAGYKWLIKNFVIVQIEERTPIRINLGKKEETKNKYISGEELLSYRYVHPYMYSRGLTDQIINYFDIGYDKKTQCITFPVWDKTASGVLFIQRRSVLSKYFHFEKDLPKGETLYGIKAVLEHLEKIKVLNKLIVCESSIDALTSWKYKKPAVALMGCLITYEQIKILESLPVDNYLLGLDNDKAGMDGNKRIKSLMKRKRLYDMDIPDYAKDLNDVKERDWENIDKLKLFKKF